MAKGNKALCEWKKKDLERNRGEYIEKVRPAQYLCTKCGRVAARKKDLCKPCDMNGEC